MKRRWIQINGELVEVSSDYVHVRHANASHNIIPDIQPYQSMIDGRMITSRSTHREHLKAHGCIEVGNETKYLMDKAQPLKPPPGLKQRLIEVANEKLR